MVKDVAPKSKEELELENAVFGDSVGFESELAKLGLDGALNGESDDDEKQSASDEDSGENDEELYYIDKGSDEEMDDDLKHDDSQSSDDSEADVAVWADSDDEATQVNLTATNRTKKLRTYMEEDVISGSDYEKRLRSHFEKLYPRPAWAKPERSTTKNGLDSESDEDIEDDNEDGTSRITTNPLKDLLARKTNYISQTKSRLLPTSDLDIQRLADITKQLKSQAVVQSVTFHPVQPLVLTSGFDKSLRIYQVDGKTNPLATSLYIENSPFRNAVFHPDGKRVIAAGRRRYMFIWNLETGTVEKISRLYGHEHTQSSFEKFVISPDGEYIALVGDNGWMNLLGADTGHWIAGAKIEGSIVDICWTEPETLSLVNSSGEVWVWDVAARRTKYRWRDSSLVGATCMAQSAHWVAIGMESGIVSVYDRRNPKKGIRWSGAEPENWESNSIVENLVTAVSSMEFSPDGQMLVIASKLKRDALRIVHVPSFTVFKNWPTSSTPLGHVTSVAWSPQNQMLAAGNEGGHVRLWSLNHYAV